MRTRFTEEEKIEFSSILDSLYTDYEAFKEAKAKEKGEKDDVCRVSAHITILTFCASLGCSAASTCWTTSS